MTSGRLPSVDLNRPDHRRKFISFCKAIESCQRPAGDQPPPKVTQSLIAAHLAPPRDDAKKELAAGDDAKKELAAGNVSKWLQAFNKAVLKWSQTVKSSVRKEPRAGEPIGEEPPIAAPFENSMGTIGWRVTPTGRALCRLWNRQFDDAVSVYRSLQRNPTTEMKPFLTIAAGDTVRSYLLPHVARRLAERDEAKRLHLDAFRNPDSFYQLEDGGIDAIVTWEVPEETGPHLRVTPIDGTDTRPHVIFSPRHPLATDHRDHPVTRVHRDTLRHFPLVYPPIPSLSKAVQRLERLKDVPTGEMNLPSIGYYVLSTHAVGLVPGWPWVLRDLRQRFGVRTVPVSDDIVPGTADDRLRLITREEGAATRQALLDVIAESLTDLAAGPWAQSERPIVVADLEGEWYFYYVTFGNVSRDPLPAWCVGKLRLGAGKRSQELTGELELIAPFPPGEWTLDVVAELVPWNRGALILRTYRQGGREPATSVFPEYLRLPNGDGEVLSGINVFVNIAGKLTASKALLSRTELPTPVRDAYLRQEHTLLLAANLANEPRILPTADTR